MDKYNGDKWVLFAEFPFTGWEADDRLHRAARRYSDASGTGPFGAPSRVRRDLNWYFKTYRGALNTALRLRRAKVRGLRLKVIPIKEYVGNG